MLWSGKSSAQIPSKIREKADYIFETELIDGGGHKGYPRRVKYVATLTPESTDPDLIVNDIFKFHDNHQDKVIVAVGDEIADQDFYQEEEVGKGRAYNGSFN